MAEASDISIAATRQLVIKPVSPSSETNSAGNPTSSKGTYIIPAHYSWDGSWELATDLLVEITVSSEDVVAAAVSVQEYGIGTSVEEAVVDLLTSMEDYRQSLEARQDKLGLQASKDLQMLRDLARPVPDK